MRNFATRAAMGLLLALIALTPLKPATGQEPSMPVACGELAFSTEEDFVTHGPEPADGNPYISDGDLLGKSCIVCARNVDLLMPFDVTVDLGLDAADVIDAEAFLVAFSTELDSPHGDQFTAGDLLVNAYGVIIPNVALTHPFQVGYDVGLDGLHFVGSEQKIDAFLTAIRQAGMSRDDWLQTPSRLSGMLDEYEIDIWFSTEGTWAPVGAAGFLDGDVLSARDGVIVAHIQDLLPPDVPAGIPQRGVDFGLDGVTTDRQGNQEGIHFSTEILYDNERSFTDGDVLLAGSGTVVYTNQGLVACFEPKANFLGLDAFHAIAVEKPTRGVYLPVVLRATSPLMR
jgi:hypothetical protein